MSTTPTERLDIICKGTSRRWRIESEFEVDPPSLPERRRKARRPTNAFIETEAGVDGDASEDESDDDDDDLADFIVDDDVED